MNCHVRDRSDRIDARTVWTFEAAHGVVVSMGLFFRRSRPPFAAVDVGTAFVRVGTPSEPVRVERATRARRGRPAAMRGGVVNDVSAAADVIETAISEAGVRKCRLVVSAPATVSALERTALLSALRGAGVQRSPILIEEPIAAAIGLGLDIADDLPRLIVDVGYGITEAAVIANGGIRAVAAVPVGCAQLDAGDDVDAPQSACTMSAAATITAIVRTVRDVLDDSGPETAASIDCIHLVGGGSLIPDVGDQLASATCLGIDHATDALHAVVRGDVECAIAVAQHRLE
jgi:rod shape-determining protein MreB